MTSRTRYSDSGGDVEVAHNLGHWHPLDKQQITVPHLADDLSWREPDSLHDLPPRPVQVRVACYQGVRGIQGSGQAYVRATTTY
jgi:hypothetical protein